MFSATTASTPASARARPAGASFFPRSTVKSADSGRQRRQLPPPGYGRTTTFASRTARSGAARTAASHAGNTASGSSREMFIDEPR